MTTSATLWRALPLSLAFFAAPPIAAARAEDCAGPLAAAEAHRAAALAATRAARPASRNWPEEDRNR